MANVLKLSTKFFLGTPREIKRGDFERVWRKADHQIKGVFYSNGQEQFIWSQGDYSTSGEGDEILIRIDTNQQSQEVVAHMLIGLMKLSVLMRMGGTFGGKEAQWPCQH